MNRLQKDLSRCEDFSEGHEEWLSRVSQYNIGSFSPLFMGRVRALAQAGWCNEGQYFTPSSSSL